MDDRNDYVGVHVNKKYLLLLISMLGAFVATANVRADVAPRLEDCQRVRDVSNDVELNLRNQNIEEIWSCNSHCSTGNYFGYSKIRRANGLCMYKGTDLITHGGSFDVWKSDSGKATAQYYFSTMNSNSGCPDYQDEQYVKFSAGVTPDVLKKLVDVFGGDISLSRVLDLAGPFDGWNSLYREIRYDLNEGTDYKIIFVATIPSGHQSIWSCDNCVLLHYELRNEGPNHRRILVSLRSESDGKFGYLSVEDREL